MARRLNKKNSQYGHPAAKTISMKCCTTTKVYRKVERLSDQSNKYRSKHSFGEAGIIRRQVFTGKRGEIAEKWFSIQEFSDLRFFDRDCSDVFQIKKS
ncbi:hypothetical protein HGH92_11225 [Chitinophaga varians]|uniref:Uncharacterized protein n=1 Tax=Chitinophaga varians TaxID=2202339 RepID=A0A847RV95_9BACT|nr:hypothetical protein [Chitinophaga varians]NLR64875.1 hypothetical protein [Chitinophaga varians]